MVGYIRKDRNARFKIDSMVMTRQFFCAVLPAAPRLSPFVHFLGLENEQD